MSALDQAIIKAYAKDRPAAPLAQPTAPPRQLAATTMRSQAQANVRPRTQTIEQLYHDGSLYRVESPAVTTPRARVLPKPHLALLPPTSPKRGVRRSMLKLLAAQQTAEPVEVPAEPPRVARKVIIRHVSHASAPPPLGMLRSSASMRNAASQIAEQDAELTSESQAELAPEQYENEAPLPPVSVPLAPQIAPLNYAIEECPPIQVRGQWSEHDEVAPLVVVAEKYDSSAAIPPVVTLQLDALVEAERAIQDWKLATADALASRIAPFAVKSFQDQEEPSIRFRVDSPHALAQKRPHARFVPIEPPAVEDEAATAANEPLSAPAEMSAAENIEPAVPADVVEPAEMAATVEETIEPAVVPDATEAIAMAALAAEAAAIADLQFAEPLASDLIPAEQQIHAEQELAEIAAGAAAKPSKPALPLWEVDRFHWPRTCEKLFADEQGYLARAGDKLMAAVQDGLRVLAITGSRRGEGRTTLALCLARAAAQAGIQAAIMDADFARPQLASKVALEVAYGWQDAAIGKIPLSEAAVKSLADNVTLLPLESSALSRSLSLADPRVTATIRAAAATFELLILDLGPQAAGVEMKFPLGEACPLDAAIVVRDLRFATAAESESVGHALEDAGIEAVGVAENFVIEEEIPATSV